MLRDMGVRTPVADDVRTGMEGIGGDIAGGGMLSALITSAVFAEGERCCWCWCWATAAVAHCMCRTLANCA